MHFGSLVFLYLIFRNFVRILFNETSWTRNLSPRRMEQSLSCLLMQVNHAKLARIINIANMSFNAIHENNFLEKISEFSVLYERDSLCVPFNTKLHQNAR